jgi:aminoglycoside phosphotransferase (APT) family kinase protein
MSTDDLDRLAAAIERAFPDSGAVRPLRVLGSGFRSVPVETAGGVVVKVGQSADAAADYAKEWRMGGFVAARLGELVPEPRWYAAPCEGLPYWALAYRKLEGATPAWGADPGAAFARDLGAFMARLHGVPIEDARVAGVPDVNAYERMLGARDVVAPVLAAALDAGELAAVQEWWSAFAADARMRTGRRALCHHDLWHDNVLRSDEGRLSGVLDIAHVEISDPAHDFAAPAYFGAAFMRELVASYRASGGLFDAEDEHRAQRFFEAREFGGLAWAVEHDDVDEIAASIEKVRRGAVLAPRRFI